MIFIWYKISCNRLQSLNMNIVMKKGITNLNGLNEWTKPQSIDICRQACNRLILSMASILPSDWYHYSLQWMQTEFINFNTTCVCRGMRSILSWTSYRLVIITINGLIERSNDHTYFLQFCYRWHYLFTILLSCTLRPLYHHWLFKVNTCQDLSQYLSCSAKTMMMR